MGRPKSDPDDLKQSVTFRVPKDLRQKLKDAENADPENKPSVVMRKALRLFFENEAKKKEGK